MFAKLFPAFRVFVYGEGISATHRARDWNEALEWASCYPPGFASITILKRGKIVAAR